jgi:hypothetical protein
MKRILKGGRMRSQVVLALAVLSSLWLSIADARTVPSNAASEHSQHRGQAELYLRDKGIKPPSYMI